MIVCISSVSLQLPNMFAGLLKQTRVRGLYIEAAVMRWWIN
jgi:hypothetical protein